MQTQWIKIVAKSLIRANVIVTLLQFCQLGTPVMASDAPAVDFNRVRVAHAKEILGKRYSRSQVKLAESLVTVNDFVRAQVVANLKHATPEAAQKVATAVIESSEKYQFDPVFLLAVIRNESRFNPRAIGSVGEIGLMQIRPTTAKELCKKHHIFYRGKQTLLDPAANVRIGSAYLAKLRGQFSSHSRLYLSAYNMGSKNVRRALAKKTLPKDYAFRVVGFYLDFYDELTTTTTAQAIAGATQPDMSLPTLVSNR